MRALAGALLLVAWPAAACPGLELSEGWIREAPPGAAAMAGYARLRNSGATPLTLGRASSPAFGAAELHRTVVDNGVSRMLRDQVLRLAPGEQAELAPGGWHLMLFRPRAELRAGDVVPVTLECGGPSTTFSFTVRQGA